MKKSLHVMMFLAIFIVSGCGIKQEISSSKAYLVTIKTPQMALSDTGFLNQGKEYAQLQIFSAGAVLFHLEVSKRICLDGRCLEKIEFNKHFFGTEHYAELMNDIIAKNALYDGVNRQETVDGFSQEIHLPQTSIVYRVQGDARYFKDSKQGILLRLTPLNP